VSSSAAALVSGLLSADPRERPTASRALGDGWLLRGAGAERAAIPSGLVENLCRFKSRDVLSKVALRVLAGLLDDAELRPLRRAFLALDADGDGRLSRAELREGLARGGRGLSEQELVEILDGVDVNGNGTIEYTEFLASTVDVNSCLGEDMCQHVFDVLDRDGDGHISRQDLMCCLRDRHLSEGIGAESQALVDALGARGDVSLNVTEFAKMLCR